MSMFSITSASLTPSRAAVRSNGYRLTHTRSIGSTLALDQDAPRVAGIEPHRPRGDQPDGLGQQLVLELVEPFEHLVRGARIRDLNRALEDHRAGVDAVVDEVDRHPEDLDPVF